MSTCRLQLPGKNKPGGAARTAHLSFGLKLNTNGLPPSGDFRPASARVANKNQSTKRNPMQRSKFPSLSEATKSTQSKISPTAQVPENAMQQRLPLAAPRPHRKRPAVPCAAGCVRARGHEDLPLGRARCLRWRRAQAQPPPTGRAHDKITRQDRERPAPRRHMDTLARVTRGEDSRGRGRAHTPSPPASHGGQPMNMAEQCTFTFQNGRACGSSYIQSVHTATT